jgi:hypothetical protein
VCARVDLLNGPAEQFEALDDETPVVSRVSVLALDKRDIVVHGAARDQYSMVLADRQPEIAHVLHPARTKDAVKPIVRKRHRVDVPYDIHFLAPALSAVGWPVVATASEGRATGCDSRNVTWPSSVVFEATLLSPYRRSDRRILRETLANQVSTASRT